MIMLLLHNRSRHGWLLLLLTLWWPISVYAASDVTISLKTRVSIDEDVFTLGQIADVRGSVQAQTEKFRRLVIGSAPQPGFSSKVYPSLIVQRLKHSGMDPEQYRFAAQGPVEVHRRYGSLTPEQVRAALIAYIKKNSPWHPEQMKIRPIAYRHTHKLPPGKVGLQVLASKHTDWLGAETFTVNILVDGRRVKRIFVPVYIEAWSPVVLSGRPLSRGQPIGARDLIVQHMDLARAPANALVSKDQVVGSVTTRTIAANTILRSDQITAPALVRKGDVVKVVAESGHFKISTQAVAQESGSLGERIELMNLNSKKKIYARIVDSRTVQVQF